MAVSKFQETRSVTNKCEMIYPSGEANVPVFIKARFLLAFKERPTYCNANWRDFSKIWNLFYRHENFWRQYMYLKADIKHLGNYHNFTYNYMSVATVCLATELV